MSNLDISDIFGCLFAVKSCWQMLTLTAIIEAPNTKDFTGFIADQQCIIEVIADIVSII